MNIIIWILIAYATSLIIVEGSIFDGPRERIAEKSDFFGNLLNCIMCTSTWVGFFYSITIWSPSSSLFTNCHPLSYIFLDGMIACGGAWIINSMVTYFKK